MEHHHFTLDGINTLLKLQDKITDSVFTRNPMAGMSHLHKSKNTAGDANGWRCGTEMENLSSGCG